MCQIKNYTCRWLICDYLVLKQIMSFAIRFSPEGLIFCWAPVSLTMANNYMHLNILDPVMETAYAWMCYNPFPYTEIYLVIDKENEYSCIIFLPIISFLHHRNRFQLTLWSRKYMLNIHFHVNHSRIFGQFMIQVRPNLYKLYISILCLQLIVQEIWTNLIF